MQMWASDSISDTGVRREMGRSRIVSGLRRQKMALNGRIKAKRRCKMIVGPFFKGLPHLEENEIIYVKMSDDRLSPR